MVKSIITIVKQLLCKHDWRQGNYCLKCGYDRSYKQFMKRVKREQKMLNDLFLNRWE